MGDTRVVASVERRKSGGEGEEKSERGKRLESSSLSNPPPIFLSKPCTQRRRTCGASLEPLTSHAPHTWKNCEGSLVYYRCSRCQACYRYGYGASCRFDQQGLLERTRLSVSNSQDKDFKKIKFSFEKY